MTKSRQVYILIQTLPDLSNIRTNKGVEVTPTGDSGGFGRISKNQEVLGKGSCGQVIWIVIRSFKPNLKTVFELSSKG